MTRRADVPPPPPLLVWREQSEIERLTAERAALAERIARLQPRAHYRLELEVRLRELTARQIRLETELKAAQ